jgi:hypothetical protein
MPPRQTATQTAPASAPWQQLAPHLVPSLTGLHMPSPLQVPSWHSVWQRVSGVPALTSAQVPSGFPVWAITHARHMAVQARSQQTRSAQWPLAHSVPAAQAWPLALAGAWQVPVAPSHTMPPVQSPSTAQRVLHAVALAQTRLFAQAMAMRGAQVPFPSQRGAGVRVAPVHIGWPHTVLATSGRQRPGMAPVVGPAHAKQGSPHRLSQQTPSAQKPD